MGHHIDEEGRFQSDKLIRARLERPATSVGAREVNVYLAPDKIALSFHDPAARKALRVFAATTDDNELAVDVLDRVQRLERGAS